VGFPPELALATKNPGKVREILEICREWPVRWRTAADPGAAPGPEVAETGATYLDNALLKARAAAEATGVTAVADDSGIEVDALDGGPGPRSARFAGPDATDEANLRLLIERVRQLPEEERRARYRCVAACGWPDGREVWAEGVCEGRVIVEPMGSGGFGYDPIFVPDEAPDRTMAQLSPDEKNAISHRGRALRALGEILAATPDGA
jgi:XTP/dITP diphosphohydrolase